MGRPFPEDNGLTPEERDRLRDVFSQVWNEPDVVAAREAVHQATVAYREAVKAAVEQRDPSIAPLLEKMHRHILSSAGRHHTGPGPGPGPGGGRPGGPLPPLPADPREAMKRLLEHEPGFASLDESGKKRLLELAQKALEQEELQETLSSAIKIQQPVADALQARRMFRDRLIRAMAALDPWVDQVLRRAPRERNRPEGAQPLPHSRERHPPEQPAPEPPSGIVRP